MNNNFFKVFELLVIYGTEKIATPLIEQDTHRYPHSIPTSTEILSLQSYLAEKWKFSVFF